MRELLTGNEAVARGAYEAGVTVATAYPGTPSTEILENVAKYQEIYSEWAPNEKVALEVGLGAAIGGARVLVAMKHVGVNVAADPLFTASYTGVSGGLVLITADDPGMHSSQNEQDNRNYARFAKLPMLEPSDSQEAKDFTGLAFEISERFDTPVLLRLTTRVSHSQSLVELQKREEIALKEYVKDFRKYVMLPANARDRHPLVEKRLEALTEFAGGTAVNRMELKDKKLGIITGGISYQYVREVLPEVSVLKLGMTYPLSQQLISEFAGQVQELYVVEELEPFLEEQIKSWGIRVKGKDKFSGIGELNAESVAKAFNLSAEGEAAAAAEETLPARPPALCPGCPHRGVFYQLRRLRLTVTGDIGCYTLAAAPPLSAMDTCICMGASIGAALGLEKARGADFAKSTVAVIGDSTFLHSGLTGLLDVVYNGGSVTTIILDNRTTAMTGHQDHPGTGKRISAEPAPQVDFEQLVKALGVKNIRVVDPYNLEEVYRTVQEETQRQEPSVIIARRPCILLKGVERGPYYYIDETKCNGCTRCLRLGCPALVIKDKLAIIDQTQCTGCGLCQQVCNRKNAVVEAGEPLE